MEILVLNKDEMEKVIDIKEAIEADKKALYAYSKGGADIPLRINLDIEKNNGQSLYMPGYLPEENALGVKLVSVFPDNKDKNMTAVPSLMVMVDDKTGFPNAMMDGTYLTQLRTGAVSGAATDLLSREDSRIFTLIGTGGQAPLQLEAILSVRDIEEVYVYDINRERGEKFVSDMNIKYGEKYNTKIFYAYDLENSIKKSDIITTVTTSKTKTFEADWVKEGTHINAVGSYTPEMAEIDGKLILKSNKIYCDTKDALIESGDFRQLIDKNLFKEEDITGELGQLISKEIKGRENDREISFFETTGNAVLDIMVSKKIYDLAIEKNIGQFISL